MKVLPFLQGRGLRHTLGRIEKLIEYTDADELLFCFAYATLSGCAAFQRRFGATFWRNNRTQWLLGIDYGRTPPDALDFIASKPNTIVKIMNGASVLRTPGFVPSQDFHMKACFARNRAASASGMIAGSGNFSRRGLMNSLECGVLLTAANPKEYETLKSSFEHAWALWDDGEDLSGILADYKRRWSRSLFLPPDEEEPEVERPPSGDFADINAAAYRYFWIDAGYVTRNRGEDQPGNQIDLPRGVHRFFELHAASNQRKNTVIGNIEFVFPSETVERALRLGNNMMEKITLPIPERYGFGAYDGAIIEFERVAGGYAIRVTDTADYLRLHGRDRDLVRFAMGSGRPFGFRKRSS